MNLSHEWFLTHGMNHQILHYTGKFGVFISDFKKLNARSAKPPLNIKIMY